MKRSADRSALDDPFTGPGGPADDPLTGLLTVMGGTGSGRDVLGVLVAHERQRRRLTLRALLDTVRAAPPGALPEGTAERVLRAWHLLAEADRAGGGAARRVVDYPHTGAWAERSLRALARPGKTPAGSNTSDDPDGPAGLDHLAALAAAAAARAGLRFTTEVPVRGGAVALPTLGGYRPPVPLTGSRVRVDGDGARLWLRPPAAPGAPAPRTAEVRRGPDGVWRSAAPGWQPLPELRADGTRPVLLDHADPYRDEERHSGPYGLRAAPGLADGQHARWRTAWREAQPWLRLGDGVRALEVDALLDCLVPLGGAAGARSSATRAEAFGAVLSSVPRNGLELAGTLVHELQHTKLLALSRLTVLHTADRAPRYWAPWRPDPRPFDGLFQGTYAHLCLAGFHLAVATTARSAPVRDAAWAEHCRCRQQVEAALPQLLGSPRLTPHGRTLVTAMAAQHARLGQHAPPDGHLARATAYVETSRMLWRARKRAGKEGRTDTGRHDVASP